MTSGLVNVSFGVGAVRERGVERGRGRETYGNAQLEKYVRRRNGLIAESYRRCRCCL